MKLQISLGVVALFLCFFSSHNLSAEEVSENIIKEASISHYGVEIVGGGAECSGIKKKNKIDDNSKNCQKYLDPHWLAESIAFGPKYPFYIFFMTLQGAEKPKLVTDNINMNKKIILFIGPSF